MSRIFSSSYLIVTFGFAFRALSLSILIVLLARALGPSDFGGYAAAASLASFFSMFSGLGAGPLHVRDVAQAKLPYAISLNRTMRLVGWSMIPLAAAAMICAWFLIPHNVDAAAVLLIVLGETLYYAGADLAMRILQARERYAAMTLAICSTPAARVTIAVVMMETGALSLLSWAFVSVATGALLALCVFVWWGWQMRDVLGRELPLFHDSLAGLGFAVSTAASRVHGDADKVILARLASTATTGTYTLAYRLTDVFLLPISAGVERVFPILFRRGQHGLRHSLHASGWAIVFTLAFATVLSLGLYATASLLPWILGGDYLQTVPIAHALAAVPFSTTCWIILRTLAATSGHEKSAGVAELVGGIFNVAVTIALVLPWGWKGAVAATYLTHAVMVGSFAFYLVWRSGPSLLLRRSN